VQATEFLLKNRISGNIFSSYNKSGFLLFRLFPESKLYSDARFINEERIKKSSFIIGQFDSLQDRMEDINKLIPHDIGTIRITLVDKQKPNTVDNALLLHDYENWKASLDGINAEVIVHEAVNLYSGAIYPFVFKLVRDDTWKLIYLDGNVMIFVKDIPKFKGIIALYEKSKTFIYDEIIQECRLWLDSTTSQYYSNIALAFLLKGTADQNIHNLINKAIQLDPNNIFAQYSNALYLLLINKK